MRCFPLKKKEVFLNNTKEGFLPNYQTNTEIPLLPHPGAFSCVRRHHQHEGVDLYAQEGDAVLAIEPGKVIKIFPFTGEHINTPWWNNTWAIMIESQSGVLNYGEIIPMKNLKEGDLIQAGEVIGHIRTVLTKDKGRPMSMLHLELYRTGTQEALSSWNLDTPQPFSLCDPTELLIDVAKELDLLKYDNLLYNNINQKLKVK